MIIHSRYFIARTNLSLQHLSAYGYAGNIYTNVSKLEYNIFNRIMCMQTIHITAHKATVC